MLSDVPFGDWFGARYGLRVLVWTLALTACVAGMLAYGTVMLLWPDLLAPGTRGAPRLHLFAGSLAWGYVWWELWSRSATGYVVGREWLFVERRGVPPVRIALDTVRAVSRVPGSWRFGVEVPSRDYRRYGAPSPTFGFTGGLIGPDGHPYRAYANRHRDLVHLETDAGAVVLGPEDPERFVALLRRRIEDRRAVALVAQGAAS